MQTLYMESGQYDKAINAGERLLTVDPLDIECARRNLDAAQQKKDAVLINQWKERVQKLAGSLAGSEQPKSPEEVQAWQERVNVARQLMGSEEYILYKKAFDAIDPQRKIESLDQLPAAVSERSLFEAGAAIIVSRLPADGRSKKAFVMGERILERDQTHEDVLLMVADTLFRSKSDSQRVLSYSNRIIELIGTKPKPAGLSDGEWGRQKATYIGMAFSMIGGTYLNQEQYPQADKSLRQALSMLQGQGHEQQLAAALSYLGWANYKMKNYSEATRFYTQCMAISGSYQESAIRNLSVIKSEEAEQH